MKRLDILHEALEMARHNRNCYGTNYGAEPKEGYAEQWEAECKKVSMIQAMIDELCYRKDGEVWHLFVGTVGGYGFDGKVNHVTISIKDTGNQYSALNAELTFSIAPDLYNEWFGRDGHYDDERHRRYDEGMNTDLKFFVRLGYLEYIEWIEP